jgi:hypothetical protein
MFNECSSMVKSNATKRRLVLETPFVNRSIISYGLVVYAKNTKRFLLIQRKHSVEFLLFIRGSYRVTHLPLLLSCITMEEATIIKNTYIDKTLFLHLFLYELCFDKEHIDYAFVRFHESKDIVLTILNKVNVVTNTLSWSWPKGRLHTSREAPFECAKREFVEEVEHFLPDYIYISDNYIGEIMNTIIGRNIESRYWIYIIEDEFTLYKPTNNAEVSNRIWATNAECKKLLHYTTLLDRITDMIDKTIENKII